MNLLKKIKAKRLYKKIGVQSLTDVADKLKALDWVLNLFGMGVGADDLEISSEGASLTKARISVYFFN